METLLANSILAVAFLIGAGGISTAFAFAILGGKFLEGVARQPEVASTLQIKMFIVAGLIDAIPIIGVAVALLIAFAHPYIEYIEHLKTTV